KKIAAPQFRIWSPTTLLSVALCSLTNVDRTGNSASCMVWPQPKVCYEGCLSLTPLYSSEPFYTVGEG
ncbi:hypothetical protein METBIDRAFT_44171, partial [Metschnikowia bicuspidata var. bicuspidata NRRL YB-4993]